MFVETAKLNGFSVVNFAKRKEVTKVLFPNSPTGFSNPNNLTHGSGISPDGKTLWVNSRAANATFVYSLPELELVGHVPMAELKVEGHAAITADPHWLTIFSGEPLPTNGLKSSRSRSGDLKNPSAVRLSLKKRLRAPGM